MPTLRATILAAALALLAVTACNPSRTTTGGSFQTTHPVGEVPASPPSFTEISMAAQTARVPVIMYHDVIPERTRDSEWFDISSKEFEDQLNWMLQQGITPISVAALYDHLTKGTPVPERSIVLTFDDNYEGFHQNAWPIVQKFQVPVMMFVHTGYVGDTSRGRPKMTWDELKDLVKSPLFAIGAHTVTHPDDITTLPAKKQFEEMKRSKDELEKQLGTTIPFLAYPNGKNDATSQEQAQKAGFLMAFSIHNVLAEESPSILSVGRYVHTKLEKAWAERDAIMAGAPIAVYDQPLRDAPISQTSDRIKGVKLIMVTGGQPASLSSTTRKGVLDFVADANAVAGINGTFFSMAAIKGTDNRMVGPSKTSDVPLVVADTEPFRWPKLRNRPLVIWGVSRIAIVPFQPETMNSDDSFRAFMPDLTDAFLGGAWLVHNAVPRTEDEIETVGSKDAKDPRRRAFFGVMADGTVAIGASKNSVTSEMLARALAASGVVEAVLLDSGFSTSLVFDGQILASGHSTDTTPSRPVPHAIVLRGTKAVPTTPVAPVDPETKP